MYIINILKDDLHYVQVLASLSGSLSGATLVGPVMRAAPESFPVELQIGLRSQLNYLPPLNPRFI